MDCEPASGTTDSALPPETENRTGAAPLSSYYRLTSMFARSTSRPRFPPHHPGNPRRVTYRASAVSPTGLLEPYVVDHATLLLGGPLVLITGRQAFQGLPLGDTAAEGNSDVLILGDDIKLGTLLLSSLKPISTDLRRPKAHSLLCISSTSTSRKRFYFLFQNTHPHKARLSGLSLFIHTTNLPGFRSSRFNSTNRFQKLCPACRQQGSSLGITGMMKSFRVPGMLEFLRADFSRHPPAKPQQFIG